MKRRVARIRDDIKLAVASIESKANKHRLDVEDVMVRNRYGEWVPCKFRALPANLGYMSEYEIARLYHRLLVTDNRMIAQERKSGG